MRRSAPFPVLFFASAAHGMNHVLLTLYLTLVLVMGPSWHLSYAALIALWAPGAMLVGLGAPLAGWLGDRWGETRVLILCFLGLGASAVLAGLSQSTLALEGALALLGLSGAIYHPVGIPWVVKHAELRGRAIAQTGIAGSFGVAAGPVVAGGLATLAGWRIGFIVPGLVTIALGAALAWFHFSGRITDRRDDAHTPHAAPSRADMARTFATLGITMTVSLLLVSAFITALPKLVEIGTGLGQYGFFAIGLAVGAIQLAGSSAQFAGGHFADRGAAKRAYIGGLLATAAVLPLVAISSGWALAFAAIAAIFLFEWVAPIETLFMARYTPAESARRRLRHPLRAGHHRHAAGRVAGVAALRSRQRLLVSAARAWAASRCSAPPPRSSCPPTRAARCPCRRSSAPPLAPASDLLLGHIGQQIGVMADHLPFAAFQPEDIGRAHPHLGDLAVGIGIFALLIEADDADIGARNGLRLDAIDMPAQFGGGLRRPDRTDLAPAMAELSVGAHIGRIVGMRPHRRHRRIFAHEHLVQRGIELRVRRHHGIDVAVRGVGPGDRRRHRQHHRHSRSQAKPCNRISIECVHEIHHQISGRTGTCPGGPGLDER